MNSSYVTLIVVTLIIIMVLFHLHRNNEEVEGFRLTIPKFDFGNLKNNIKNALDKIKECEDNALDTVLSPSESCTEQSGTLQGKSVQIKESNDYRPTSNWGQCPKGYKNNSSTKKWYSGVFNQNDHTLHKYQCDLIDDDPHWKEEYAPKIVSDQVECCGRSNEELADIESQRKCAPFCPRGVKCGKLMKNHCVCGTNTFNETGETDTTGGTGNFFSNDCVSWMKNYPDAKDEAMEKLCKQNNGNWKSLACKNWCAENPDKCKSKMVTECSKPENWGLKECVDWCNEDCESGNCPNLGSCKVFVEKAENCGTKAAPGDKKDDPACACYKPLSERGIPKFRDANPILDEQTSCVDGTCRGYMSHKCTGNIIACTQNYNQKHGKAEDIEQNMDCNQYKDENEEEESEEEDDEPQSEEDDVEDDVEDDIDEDPTVNTDSDTSFSESSTSTNEDEDPNGDPKKEKPKVVLSTVTKSSIIKGLNKENEKWIMIGLVILVLILLIR